MAKKKRTTGFVVPGINEEMREQVEHEIAESSLVLTQPSQTVTFTLQSGQKVAFTRHHVDANEVEAKTFVDFALNGRHQEDLTRTSLQPIIASITQQQFYPVIAVEEDGRFNALDGSRRRMAAIYAGVGLDLLYTKEAISRSDAKALAKSLQTSAEHSARDMGRWYAILRENLSQAEIAQAEARSESHISKCLKAWSVPQSMIDLFSDPKELTQANYNKLAQHHQLLNEQQVELSTVLETLKIQPGTSNDEIIIFLQEAMPQQQAQGPVLPPPRDLFVASKDKFIRVKSPSKSKRVIELSRIAQTDLDKIEQFIGTLMNEKNVSL
ncbi:ParB/RepB/Spo0J family partition protein [Shewanella sp. YLB-07]|uniref:ParB/RepB/Spo0J family partition protein n=1 Tax=Shewanella sp. YLB-07 TaxID=2601268 RepID=UPI00128E8B3B|nr:ParB/RepB/Spo0J family partition protein [Shewanella sp. YLB-07]MPY24405.1 ParB/RepB/Spo0J family partition protein [Shewanella sp. YLB-07]